MSNPLYPDAPFYNEVETGGGTVDLISRAANAANKAAIETIKLPAGQSVDQIGDLAWGTDRIWSALTATSTVPNPATDATFALDPLGWEEFTGSAQVDEVVLSATTDLTGVAPVGAKSGVNVATGTEFIVVAGNWTLQPRSAQTPTHYPDVIRTNATRGVVPTTVETSTTLVDGDMISIFLSDKTQERWKRAGGVWPAPHTIEPGAIIPYNTYNDLPDPTSVMSGTQVIVVNDPNAALRGTHNALGTNIDAPALYWRSATTNL